MFRGLGDLISGIASGFTSNKAAPVPSVFAEDPVDDETGVDQGMENEGGGGGGGGGIFVPPARTANTTPLTNYLEDGARVTFTAPAALFQGT